MLDTARNVDEWFCARILPSLGPMGIPCVFTLCPSYPTVKLLITSATIGLMSYG